MTLKKPADADHPIHDLIRDRWSPRAFADKPVPKETLLSLLEAPPRFGPLGDTCLSQEVTNATLRLAALVNGATRMSRLRQESAGDRTQFCGGKLPTRCFSPGRLG